ncbi:MAG: hypothetical protein J6B63_04790 [Treponema sp.]|nr:hypothetical protein [Treponema sp.]MBP3606871.1 hypothetical protein [Treponema sp.]
MDEAINTEKDKGLPEKITNNPTEEKQYILPPWRVNQIIAEAITVLSENDFYKDDFDYQQMIRSMGIRIKSYSSFKKENLEEFKKISLSLWDEGLCLAFPNEQTGETCRMIAFNDQHSPAEVMHIILHEFGHFRLKHTQQSINGEVEATCFAAIITLLLLLEVTLHFGKKMMQNGNKDILLQILKSRMIKQEAPKNRMNIYK